MWTILMVTVEDEGRLMPIGKVDDEGRKILEACYQALPEELVKSLKEQGLLKKGSIRVDMEELDLEEIDFERLSREFLVLEDQISTMKDIMGKTGREHWG
ncbi:hypothetical protein ACB098_05G214300 [Castanea mollissima]